MSRRFYVITGGTMVHVTPHFSLCAPAYGTVGEEIYKNLREGLRGKATVILVRTKMALGSQKYSAEEKELFQQAGVPMLETNEDLKKVLQALTADHRTKGIILPVAVCDWEPRVLEQDSLRQDVFGKKTNRLRTSQGEVSAVLAPAEKLIQTLRKTRKDIFVVGFKSTAGLSTQAQYLEGLRLLKTSSCNLVFSNDLQTRCNMVITPEESHYGNGLHPISEMPRERVVDLLCYMIRKRAFLTFTRSEIVEGEPIAWESPDIPESLRKVVNHCIERGAYKPFLGKTVGHFACRGPSENVFYTSRRHSNFNRLAQDGLLRIEAINDSQVKAFGGKPSVGGQSQRIIFSEHQDLDCIVHFHCPLKEGSGEYPEVPERLQIEYECGSHECGRNTSEGLQKMVYDQKVKIKAVMLDEHGPNIVFSRDTPAEEVIRFIEDNFDLTAKTGGLVELSEG